MKKILVILAVAALVGCGKVEEPAKEQNPLPTGDQATEAILRGHPNSLQVCYDSRLNGFFLDYGPMLPAGADNDNKYHGWLWIEAPNFFLSANGKWFMQELAVDKYVQVYPDTNGLPCKQH